MTQISQVANHQIIHMDDIDRIAPVKLSPLIVVKRRDARNQHITNLVLARLAHHARIPANDRGIIMPWMSMADGDDGGAELTQLLKFSRRGVLLRRERVSDNNTMLAT